MSTEELEQNETLDPSEEFTSLLDFIRTFDDTNSSISGLRQEFSAIEANGSAGYARERLIERFSEEELYAVPEYWELLGQQPPEGTVEISPERQQEIVGALVDLIVKNDHYDVLRNKAHSDT